MLHSEDHPPTLLLPGTKACQSDFNHLGMVDWLSQTGVVVLLAATECSRLLPTPVQVGWVPHGSIQSSTF